MPMQRRQPQLPTLRPYQQEIVDSAWDALPTKQRVLAVSPTATGKTVCMLHLAARGVAMGVRVLMMVPAHLVEQTVERVRSARLRVDAERGTARANRGVDVVVASVETLSGSSRLERWCEDHFGLLLVDEAHHSRAETWRRIIEYFDSAKVVGFTATPDRADGRSLMRGCGGLYDDVCYEYVIKDAIADGWLSPVVQRFVEIEGLDYSSVRKEAMDLNAGDLDKVVNNATIVRLMGSATTQLCAGRQTVIFCVSVDHAYAFAEYLRTVGCTAATIEGKTSSIERRQLEQDFESGKIQYLCNVNCFSEGWDCPPVSAVVQARSTTSRALYAQQIGRGLRLYPGKQNCLVVDFLGNSGRHTLVHAAHVLDPDLGDRQAARAAEIQAAKPELSVEEAIQLALKDIELEDARALLQAEVRRSGQIDASVSVTDVDPFVSSDSKKVYVDLFQLERQEDRWGRSATDRQAEALRRFGVKDPEMLSAREASVLLDTLVSRAQQKRATLRQVRMLIRAGTHPDNAKAMSFERAQAGIDELKKNGWRRPASWGPRQTEAHPSLRPQENLHDDA